jgi:SAM-dependent methyltransferase
MIARYAINLKKQMVMTSEGFTVAEGIRCYAPELAYLNSDFPSEQFDSLYEAEEHNFWFRARNRIIQDRFRKAGFQDKSASFLEIGCGTAYVLKGLESQFPQLELSGSEIYLSGLVFARKRLPNAEFVQLDATKMPFESQFDAVGAFDVLEHIEADVVVMQNAHKALKGDGRFFITVPQHQWLWSAADDVACHKRRYSRREIEEKLRSAGFEVEYVSSFVFTLLPLMYLSRLRSKGKKASDLTQEQIMAELRLHPLINGMFSFAMRIDEWLMRLGVRLPAGGSLIVTARKITSPARLHS